MKEGDKVRLVGMVGTVPAARVNPQLKKRFDEMMVQTFEAIGVTINDEGVVTGTYTDGWAEVKFSQWERPIDTPQANLEVL